MHQFPLVIRSAQESDATAVAAVYAPYVQNTAVSFEVEAPTAETMARRISDTRAIHPWLVATHDGEIVAYACASKHSQRPAYRWTVDVTIYVRGQERRSRIGYRLYGALLATLRAQGFRSAFAEIVLPNPGSVRLHEAMGFRHIGIHEGIGFKLGQWQDIGYWQLGLGDGATPPGEPIPFTTFEEMPAFVEILHRSNQC